MKTLFIANSLSARRCAADWRRVEDYARRQQPAADISMTESPGQATGLARDAIRAGYDLLVAVGGDGTLNEAINGFFEGGALLNEDAVLATIPLGSGCDCARSLGIRGARDAFSALEAGMVARIDLLKVGFNNSQGQMETRACANIADLGAGGMVVRRAHSAPRILGRRPNYTWGMLCAALGYRARTVSVSIDGRRSLGLRSMNLIIANGRYFARGCLAAPNALMDDGVFDVVNIGNFNVLESLWQMPKLRSGRHLGLNKVSCFLGRKLEARSDEEVLLELDGELVGKLPATIEMMPRAVAVVIASAEAATMPVPASAASTLRKG